MSLNHSLSKNSIKKIKLDEADENVSSILEYKRIAILKFCNENGTKSCKYDEMISSNDVIGIGTS